MNNKLNILINDSKIYAIDGLKNYFVKIYGIMATGLLVTTTAALMVFTFSPLRDLIFYVTPNGYLLGLTGIGKLISFAPLGISMFFSFGMHKINARTAQLLFWVYATLIGIMLASLGFLYTGESIVKTLFVCTGMFGGMSLYGYTTKKDLTQMGSLLYMGVLGLVLASLVNIFLHSSQLEFILSFFGVIIFTGLTAYDTQKLKALYYAGAEKEDKIGIMAAFSLYLDFLNLFLYLLKFMGGRKKN